MRKDKLTTGEIYHVLNKSIAGYEIFNDASHFLRIKELLRYYNRKNIEFKFSRYAELLCQGKDIAVREATESEKLVTIIAYCIMPTHIHLILKQLCDNGISTFMRKISDSYTRYFNVLHNRKGPLWVGRFKNVLVESDKQLLHLTRYVHLNPVSAGLIDKPKEWQDSSYNEYLGTTTKNANLSNFQNLLEIEPKAYKKFVNSRRSYQRELSIIKKIVID